MIIVNQDKNRIVNFNNILNIDVYKNRIEVNSDLILGEYETEERAKQVLQEIINKYEEDSYYIRRYCGEGCYSLKEVNHPTPKVYEMPE